MNAWRCTRFRRVPDILKGNEVTNRRLIGLVAAVAVAFSLTGCSGDSVPAETTSAAVAAAPAETTAPAAEESSQTVQEACLAMSGPLAEASLAMAESAQAGTSDPQTAVDVWTDLASGFETIADEVQNAEVKAAATLAHADIASVRDAMKKVYVDNDMGAMDEYTAATESMNESYTALLEFCQ